MAKYQIPPERAFEEVNQIVHEFNQTHKKGDKISLIYPNNTIHECTLYDNAQRVGHYPVTWVQEKSGYVYLDNILLNISN